MRFLFFGLILLSLSSCDNKIVFAQMHEMSEGVWGNSNPLQNTIEIKEVDKRFDLVLEINHTKSYPFENLYLRIKTDFPNQSSVLDTLSVEMINNTGNWVGNCSGEDCELKVMLQQNIKFKEAGNHTITFEQFTREENLQGITEVNFVVAESTL